jgi:hypothetical protein
MDMKFCFSCGMPLDAGGHNVSGNYCGYCTAADGKLKSREEVKQGVARWLKMWQPDIDDATALCRADAYTNAMPAWAAK